MWVRQDKRTLLQRLKEGRPIHTIAPRGNGALEELVALRIELGTFEMLDALVVKRQREGIPDPLLLHTASVLPFLADGSLDGSARVLFDEPAILLELGYAPVALREGVSRRHRCHKGKTEQSVPIHPDTLRDELARLTEKDWIDLQERRLEVLYRRRLIRSKKMVVDGSGLGDGERLVVLSALTGGGLVPLVWEFLTGEASEKGKEAAVTRRLVERVRKVAGEGAIESLIGDGLYADGPLLAWLQSKGIVGLFALPEDRLLCKEGLSIVRVEGDQWKERRQTRVLNGHKETRKVEVACAGQLTEWDSYMAKAQELEIAEPGLFVALVRQLEPAVPKDKELMALVSTQQWPDGWQAYEAYRPRWGQEKAGFNELKEGWLVGQSP